MLSGSITTYDAEMQQQQQQQPQQQTTVQGNLGSIDVGEPELPVYTRARSHSLRRQSISLNAVINHRRALISALLSGVGSNMSLPTCIDQDLSATEVTATLLGSGNELTRQNPEPVQHKPILLQITPPIVPLTSVDEQNVKELFDDPMSVSARRQNSQLMSSLSTLYANLLVVVGVAVPVTASVSEQVPASLDQGFYLYLYLTSVAFVIAMYGTLLRDKALKKMIVKHVKQENTYTFGENGTCMPSFQPVAAEKQISQTMPEQRCSCSGGRAQQYGSFCLRLGTVGFGAGSLVFTGLQIGAELATGGPTGALVPAARLLLTTAQMHFIFLSSRDLVLTRREALTKLGLMHLIATNICEWLQALVEETRYEIVQLERPQEPEGHDIHRQLLRDASPFLFPCTIEFSLICAVLLFEMWKSVDEPRGEPTTTSKSAHQLSIDCASAHRGLFGGILVIAATVLSLIMFFVLREAKPKMAIEQVTSLEVAIHTSGTIAAIGAAMKMRSLEYRHIKLPHLDSTLLAAAQAGVYLHTLFGAVGSILTQGPTWVVCLAADLFALLQSTTQTILIKMAWRRRSRSDEKPGKELITFLIVVNIAMWTVNTLEKSRAGVRPDHLEFFGVWAWTIITHVSMPLAIFYRFHSAICLFDVWKSCYKYRPPIAISGDIY